MSIKVKITADAGKYRQALRSIATQTKQTLGTIGNQVKQLFRAVRTELNGTNLSFKSLAKMFTAGGSIALINKGIESFQKFVRELGERYKAMREDAMSSPLEVAAQHEAAYARQSGRSREDERLLDVLEDLQYKETLTNVDRDQQRRAVEALTRAHHGLGIEIDENTRKIKNFDVVQRRVIEEDQKEELRLIQAEITALEKARGMAKSEFSYTGSWGGEYLAQLKENIGFGSMDKATEVERQTMERLLELRRREHELRNDNRADRAFTRHLARRMDSDEDPALYQAQVRSLEQKIQAQRLIVQGKREEAALQQLINAHEAKGAQVSEEKRKKLRQLIRELGGVALAEQQQQQLESLYQQALRIAGRSREADDREAIRRAEEQRGGTLTDGERASTLRIAELFRRLDAIAARRSGALDALAVSGNALTARGGGGAGAVRGAERAAEVYNRQTAEQTKLANDYLREIRDLNRRQPVQVHKD